MTFGYKLFGERSELSNEICLYLLTIRTNTHLAAVPFKKCAHTCIKYACIFW